MPALVAEHHLSGEGRAVDGLDRRDETRTVRDAPAIARGLRLSPPRSSTGRQKHAEREPRRGDSIRHRGSPYGLVHLPSTPGGVVSTARSRFSFGVTPVAAISAARRCAAARSLPRTFVPRISSFFRECSHPASSVTVTR